MKNILLPWKLIKSESVVDTPWFKLEDNHYHIPELNSDKNYYVLKERPGCNIVAVTDKKEVLVVSQYRPTIGSIVYDFPAGYVEDGDSHPIGRAKQELLEETGYESDEWTETGYGYALPNRSDKKDFFFLAKNAKLVSKQNLDHGESVKFELWPIEKLIENIKSNEFACGICQSSWFRATLADPTILN